MTAIVETTAGVVRGSEEGRVAVWKGVPFAAPPVGPLRFALPEPVPPWTGERDAAQFGPACWQSTFSLGLPGFDIGPMSEDCLSLNVFSPVARGTELWPVMVWIHGGAFVIGAGSQSLYDGAALAARGVVVVTVNYRLGAFGFLPAGIADRVAANCGIRDQIAALAWVRDNIAGFGGDPANVTIFGESAGGMSVGTLLGSPLAKGLFHKAIPQSGSCHAGLKHDDAAEFGAYFVSQLGGAAALATADPDAILAAQTATTVFAAMSGKGPATMPFQPMIGDDVVPRLPIESVAAGSAAGIPCLVGTTRDEMALFTMMDPTLPSLDRAGLVARVERFAPGKGEEIVGVYEKGEPAASVQDQWKRIATDLVFRIPGVRLLEELALASAPGYSYLFTYESPSIGGALKSCHALELPFMFGTLDSLGMEAFAGSGPAVTALSDRMLDAWVEFATTGNPGIESLPDWPEYDLDSRASMRLDVEHEVLPDFQRLEREVWDGII